MRCMHGTYIGTPLGRDILCPLCENGETELQEITAYALIWRVDGESHVILDGYKSDLLQIEQLKERLEAINTSGTLRIENYPVQVWVRPE